MEKIVGILHFLLFLFCTIYPYVFKRNWFDVYYLIFIFGAGLSWSIFNGECLISLLLKKVMNPHYKMGEEVSSEDMYDILGKEYNKHIYSIFIMLSLIQGYGIYFLLKRNQLNGFYIGAILLYLIGIKITNSILFQTIFFLLFSYILYNILHKLWI